MFRRLALLLRFADPRPAMVITALSACVFGATVGASDAAVRVGLAQAADTPALDAFRTISGVVLGALFVASGVLLGVGVARERARVVRYAALALFVCWVYVWVTIPLAGAVAGVWDPTSWARYSLSPLIAWWIMARSPSVRGPRWFPGRRRLVRHLVPALVLVPPVVAIELHLPDGLAVPTLVGAVVSILTLAGKALADRWTTRTDLSKTALLSGNEKDAFLWGVAREEIERLEGSLERLRGQFSTFLAERDRQDQWCRTTCDRFGERPRD